MLDAATLKALAQVPAIREAMAERETCWFNPKLRPFAEAAQALPVSGALIDDAEARLARCAPLLAAAFPEIAGAGGCIESPLLPVPAFQDALSAAMGRSFRGQLWLKADHALPVSGSIKARGGIYEVLKHAETLALAAGVLRDTGETTRRLLSPEARALFAAHRIAVGSTGNLGLSIGIMSARLGFEVTVHMSADAKAWKKDLLRSRGVRVVEYADDYSAAVAQGRREAEQDPHCHFIDDENSLDLFAGYAVAARRLAGQLGQAGIAVDADHPLFVTLPCGVGGGPGGVAFGLKQQFGDAVHCLFAEPVAAPCMMIGMASGLHHGLSVQDIGLSGQTCADGLAVGRASGFVGRVMEPLLSAVGTVSDGHLLRAVALLSRSEGLSIEPSAVAGAFGIAWINSDEAAPWRAERGLSAAVMAQATHVMWSTGGSMVPAAEQAATVAAGEALWASAGWGL